jgi:hypothetical protein
LFIDFLKGHVVLLWLVGVVFFDGLFGLFGFFFVIICGEKKRVRLLQLVQSSKQSDGRITQAV